MFLNFFAIVIHSFISPSSFPIIFHAFLVGKSRREAAQQAKQSVQVDANNVKTFVYGTIDTATAVVDGFVFAVKAVPAAVDTVQNLPTIIKEKKIDADRRIARTKESVDNLLAWRPLDDAQRAIVSTQRDIDDKIDKVQKLGNTLKSIVDPPPKPKPKPKPSLQPLQSAKDYFVSTQEDLERSNVYSEGKNILDKIKARNKATVERLEKERLWRIGFYSFSIFSISFKFQFLISFIFL